MKISQERKEIIIIFSILLFVLFSGAGIFMIIESWSFVDALYFTTATLTRVGFGDVVPLTYAGKIFGILYMWIGVTVAVYSIAYVGSHIIRKNVENGWNLWSSKKKKRSNPFFSL